MDRCRAPKVEGGLRLLASIGDYDAFACFAKGVLLFRTRLGEPVVLHLATTLEEAAGKLAFEGAALVATDQARELTLAASGPGTFSGGVALLDAARSRVPPAPILALVTDLQADLVALQSRPEISQVIVEQAGEDAERVALALAELLVRGFPSEFLSALPRSCTPDLRLRLSAGLRRWEAAPRSALSASGLVEELGEAGLEEAAEVVAGAALYRTWWRAERFEVTIGQALQPFFDEQAQFEACCLELTGTGPRTVLRRGGSAWVLAALGERWRSVSESGPTRDEGQPEKAAVELASLTKEDIDRFDELYRNEAFQHAVRRGARARGAPWDLQEDAVEGVFDRLWRAGPEAWKRTYSKSFFRTGGWWYADRVMKRKEWDATRRHKDIDRAEGRLTDHSQPAEEEREEKEQEARVREVVESYPEPKRGFIRLSFEEKWPSKDVGELFGMQEGAVNTRRHRLKKELREKLAGLADEG